MILIVGISIFILLVLLLIGIALPLAFFASTIYLAFAMGLDTSFIIPYGYNKINSLPLLIVPLFIIAGAFMEQSGIGEKLLDAAGRIVGKIKGGIGIVVCIACAIFGAISGSANAAMTSLAPVAFPKMYESGYDKGMACSLLASSSILSCLIPPSGMMIIYSWVTSTSVLACFLAALAPGILLTVVFSVLNMLMVRNNPRVIYRLNKEEKYETKIRTKKHDLSILWALFMPVFILGSIYGGIMTPTEAAGASALYAFFVGMFIFKRLNMNKIGVLLARAGQVAGIVMMLIFSATILSRLYIDLGLPQFILRKLTLISEDKNVILIFVNLFLMLIGMLMDDASGIVLAAPILSPVMQSLGVDMVHFAAIVGVNLGMGGITPPMAPMMYLSGKLGGATLNEMLKPSLVFILFGWLPVLLITTYFPDFALFLPRLILGY